MALTKEQIKELKNQLAEQIQHLPEDQKEQASKQIEEMSPKALESMVQQQQSQSTQKVFRSIVSGEIPSRKIDETPQAIAVLDIMPIEPGHVIIIPKTPAKNSKDLSNQTFTIAKKIAKKITSKLKPKSVEILTETKFQETIINVIPVYEKPVNLDSPRKKAQEKDLNKIQDLLKIITRKKTKVIKVKSKNLSLRKIKRRIP